MGDEPADLMRKRITAVAGQLHQAWLLAGTALPSSQTPAQSLGILPLDPFILKGALKITEACYLCEHGCLPMLVISHRQFASCVAADA